MKTMDIYFSADAEQRGGVTVVELFGADTAAFNAGDPRNLMRTFALAPDAASELLRELLAAGVQPAADD